MNAKRINEELLRAQDAWEKKLLKPQLSENSDSQSLFSVNEISRPFCFGVSDNYCSAEKRIMIVGQQTGGWNSYQVDKEKWPLAKLQEWGVDYLKAQLGWVKDLADNRKNRSPFWNFFRLIEKEGWSPCWNNLDKVQRVCGTDELIVSQEEQLNMPITNDNKSLLQKEIELAKPDRIVFVIGPRDHYLKSLCSNMGLPQGKMELCKPNPDQCCVEITNEVNIGIPVFWSYHPNYLSHHKGKMKETVEKVSFQ